MSATTTSVPALIAVAPKSSSTFPASMTPPWHQRLCLGVQCQRGERIDQLDEQRLDRSIGTGSEWTFDQDDSGTRARFVAAAWEGSDRHGCRHAPRQRLAASGAGTELP